MINWVAIKAEYITQGTPQRELARKYHVHPTTIGRRASKEHWVEERSRHADSALANRLSVAAKREAEREVTIQTIADKLLARIGDVADNLVIVKATDGAYSIRQLTAALRDIRDIKGAKSDIDLREQEARIAKLQREATADKPDTSINVVFGGGDVEEWSE